MSVETTASRFDRLSGLSYSAWLALAVVGNSYFADQSLLYRVLGILALVAVAGWWPADGQGCRFLGAGKGLPDRNSQGGLAYAPGNRANHIDRGGFCSAGGADAVGT